MKKIIALALSLCMILALVACGGTKEETKPATEAAPASEAAPAAAAEVKTYKVGVAIYQFNDNFMTLYRNEIEAYFKTLETETVKYDVQIVDSKNDMAEQSNQIDTFITQGMDVIILNLVQTSSADAIIDKIVDADIPCVLINREPLGTDGDESYAGILDNAKVCYVGADARQSGTFQGQIVADLADHGDINGDGKISYIMIEGDPENVDAQYRTQFSIKALTDAGYEVECLADQVGNWDTAQGQQIAANALTEFGDAIEVIFCNNDGMALGAYAAIEAAGRVVGEDVYLLGVDALDECVEMVNNGTMTGTVLNDHIGQSHTAVDVAVKALKGEAIENYYWVDYVMVTAGEAAEAEPVAAPVAAPVEITKDIKVAMITDYGDITDQSFNQTTYEACKEFCEANGLDFTYYKPASDSDDDRISMIEKAIDDGFNTIVTPGYAFANALKATAADYDDVTFIALDVGEGDFGDYELPANLYSAVYQEELCGYMAGYAAVKLGYEKLGYLGGMAVPAVVRYGYGFVQGANDAAVELDKVDAVTVKYVYGNQFFGDADITAYMDTWYGEGTEVVFACGGGIYTSAAEAAAKVGAKVIGVDVDQAGIIDGAYGEGMTVTSAMKGLAATVKTLLTAVGTDTFEGGKIETLGLVSAEPEENYVQIAGSTQFADGFTADDYAALVADMFAGKVTVSNAIDAEPDVAIAVDYQGNIK